MTVAPSTSLLPGPRLTVVLLAVGGLSGVVEEAITPLRDTTTGADMLAIAAHPGLFATSVVIGMLGALISIPAYLGLAGACSARTPVLAGLAGWTLTGTLAAFTATRMLQAVELQSAREGIPLEQGARLVDAAPANPVGLPIAVLFLAGTVLGFVLLGVAVWRAGLPRPAALLILLFPAADWLADALIHAHGAAFSGLLLTIGLVWSGSAVVRNRRRPDRSASVDAAVAAGRPSGPARTRLTSVRDDSA